MATEDTSVSTPDDLDAPILPDDITTEESSTDEDAIVVEDEADQSDTAEESEDTDKESEDSSEEEADQQDDQEESEVDPKEEARQRYLERQARRDTPDPYVQAIQQQAQEQLAKIEDNTQRQLAELQVKDALREIHDVRTSLVTDNEFARRDFEVFNPKSDSYNEAAYDHFLSEYEAAYVVKDQQSGEVIGTRGPSLYQYLQSKAELISNLTQAGARKGQQNEAKMRARVETPSVAAPKQPKADAFLDAFDKEF